MYEQVLEKYCIIRAERAGVFAAVVAQVDGTTVLLRDCRRIYRWAGALSVNDLAQTGPALAESKICAENALALVTGVLEVIPCSAQAEQLIRGAKTWRP